jgi:tRNA(Ile)-lysidine synthase
MLTYDDILVRLKRLEEAAAPPARYLVAFSGGVDSTLLLHALSSTRDSHGIPVVAIHIDHGLHDESGRWETHCRSIAGEYGVQYLTRQVLVQTEGGAGVEAAAREARYGVLRGLVRSGDWLLSAHHEDDQAETLLLNLLRGSGVGGLAGISRNRTFGDGRLVRPLLGIPAGTILACAKEHDLDWIDDPSNRDTRFDRNYLRKFVFPVLEERWPAASSRIRQSADLAGEASELLGDLASVDLAALGEVNRMQITGLKRLSAARQRNVIRHAIRRCGLPPAPATGLYRVVEELLPARVDAQPRISWPGGEMRRYRDALYILAPADTEIGKLELRWTPDSGPIELGPGQGRLELSRSAAGGLSNELQQQELTIRYRAGGEQIRPRGHSTRFKLKKLLQQRAVVPWMRGRIPLVYSGERLVAVADLWVAHDAFAADGAAVTWRNGPALY